MYVEKCEEKCLKMLLMLMLMFNISPEFYSVCGRKIQENSFFHKFRKFYYTMSFPAEMKKKFLVIFVTVFFIRTVYLFNFYRGGHRGSDV